MNKEMDQSEFDALRKKKRKNRFEIVNLSEDEYNAGDFGAMKAV